MTIYGIALLIVSIIIIALLYNILIRVNKLNNFIYLHVNSRHGMYSVYSLQDISEARAKSIKAKNAFEDKGGFDLSWVETYAKNGKDISYILNQAENQADLELEWDRTERIYYFMLQANIDAMRGTKSINNIQEEYSETFFLHSEHSVIGGNLYRAKHDQYKNRANEIYTNAIKLPN